MKFLEYREKRQHGTFDFPIAFYHIEPTHPRYMMTYHWHTECEIIRILKGQFHMNIDGQSVTARSGDILFIQGSIPHGGTPEDCTYECVVFDLKLLMQNNHICTKQIKSIMDHTILINTFLKDTGYAFTQTVLNIFNSLKFRNTGYEFIVQGSLYQLIGIIIGEHLYDEKMPAGNAGRHQIQDFKKVLDYIEKHYSDNISLEDLSDVAGMSPKYFCRFFKEMTERSPIDYVNYYRIECASEQLSTTDSSITEIAINCGFNDMSYFSKLFKRYKGVSPRQYLSTQFSI